MTTTENQTENMETQSTIDTETSTFSEDQMSQAMISTGDATLETVIGILKKNKIAYTELGKDQKHHTVMQLRYKPGQQPVVDDIQLIINFVEDAIALFTPITARFLKAFGDEIGLAYKQLQAKYTNRKLLSVEN